ncbi:MAG: hemerythrin domain-containing protein [Candidatus Obscuribacterales bacterium]|nr:hemerythrin domain-containing protein [Candidatus Obscuribacterales bacterium]
MSFQTIVEEIMSTHHSLLKRELPRISAQFETLCIEHPGNEILNEAKQIFTKVRNKVEVHLKDEETVLFPNGIAMERGSATTPTEINQVERLTEMEKEHDSCGNALTGIQNTLRTAVPVSDARDKLLENIQLIQDDFVVHVEKENSRVHPMFLELIGRK